MKLNSESDAAEVVKAIKVLSPFKLNSHRSALRAFLASIKIQSSRQFIFLALKRHEISNVVHLSVCSLFSALSSDPFGPALFFEADLKGPLLWTS